MEKFRNLLARLLNREKEPQHKNLNPIVETNLMMMRGKFKGGMYSPLDPESIGRTERWHNKYPVYHKNFHYDQNTGEIKYFGNWQFVPEEIRNTFYEGFFSLAIDIKKQKDRIINYSLDKPTELTEKMIQESINFFNKEYGFDAS